LELSIAEQYDDTHILSSTTISSNESASDISHPIRHIRVVYG